jgi:hypothetical protein
MGFQPKLEGRNLIGWELRPDGIRQGEAPLVNLPCFPASAGIPGNEAQAGITQQFLKTVFTQSFNHYVQLTLK